VTGIWLHPVIATDDMITSEWGRHLGFMWTQPY
jgi:hypothetical protein